jgi:hypothetical protein
MGRIWKIHLTQWVGHVVCDGGDLFRTQRTLEQLKTFGRELAMSSQGGWGSSKEFLDLVKSIGEAKSKAEEE